MSLSIESLELVSQVISSGIQQLREGGDLARQGEQLRFLKGMFLDGVSITDALSNAIVPINRLPPELLTYIFSLVREESAVPAKFPVRWPFRRYRTHTLEPALAVCRQWRELALATPSLWNRVAWGRSGYQMFSRSFGVALAIHVVSHYTVEMDEWCRNVASQIRELHIDGLVITITDLDRLMSSLRQFPGYQLEHFKIDIPATILPACSRVAHFPLFPGNKGKLRSLYLECVSFLPSNPFPALVRFALCNSAAPSLRSWGMGDLLDFLEGSPQLEELYICRVTLGKRSWPVADGPRPTNVELPNLRYFAFDADQEPSSVPIIRKLTATIRMPSSCHRYFTPLQTAGSDSIESLLAALPEEKNLTRLRIDFSGLRDTLQMVPVSSDGSISLFSSVKSEDEWNGLYALFTLSPLFANIEELWVALDQRHWSDIRTLPHLFTWFPKVKALVIAYPSPAPWRLTRSIDLGDLMKPLMIRPGGSIQCPQLDTLCINLPTEVMDVKPIAQMLTSRAETCPLRRLVIGYDPRLEWDVLAGIFALETLVEEIVIEEVREPGLSMADWLLDVPKAFFPPSSLHRSWPVWSEA